MVRSLAFVCLLVSSVPFQTTGAEGACGFDAREASTRELGAPEHGEPTPESCGKSLELRVPDSSRFFVLSGRSAPVQREVPGSLDPGFSLPQILTRWGLRQFHAMRKDARSKILSSII